VSLPLWTFFGCALAYNIPAPTAFEQVGRKYHLVFIIITSVSTVVVYFYLPETTGLMLEGMLYAYDPWTWYTNSELLDFCEKFGETPVTRFDDVVLSNSDEAKA
jgi:hypothetical protein